MPEQQPKEDFSVKRTIIFMMVLSLICALILSVLASALAEPKEIAKDLDRSKQMMIASQILSYNGYFILKDPKTGKIEPAKALPDGSLVPGNENDIPSRAQLLAVYKKRFQPFFVDNEGNEKSLQESKIDLDRYLNDHKKTGYYKEPLKLVYKILPNESASKENESTAEGYVIPINGYGLWDAIYGYLALKPDADTVMGITWYDQKETPGLGANISEEPWQRQFPGKVIFQESGSGKTDFKAAPIGITVVKGKVSDVFGDSPKAKSAVDGMAGATLTGNGVTDAYRDVLAAYRPFLIKAHEKFEKSHSGEKS